MGQESPFVEGKFDALSRESLWRGPGLTPVVRTRRRRRRTVGRVGRVLLYLLGFRYDWWRDAYVLRIIGNHVGPVFQLRASRTRHGP